MERASDKLMHDLRALVGDAEELLKATASQTGGRVEEVRARTEESVRNARERIHAAARQVSNEVQENPWTAMGVAAGVGVIVGMMLARK